MKNTKYLKPPARDGAKSPPSSSFYFSSLQVWLYSPGNDLVRKAASEWVSGRRFSLYGDTFSQMLNV